MTNNIFGDGRLFDLPYKGVDWKAVTSGEPRENEQLMELIRQYAPSKADLMQFIEELVAQKIGLSSDALEKLNALGRQLDELGQNGDVTDVFTTLGDLFERLDEGESNLRDDMDEHNSDFDAHLNERDRETLESVEDYREAMEQMFRDTGDRVNNLRERVNDDRVVLDSQIDNLSAHMGDASAHGANTAAEANTLAMRTTEGALAVGAPRAGADGRNDAVRRSDLEAAIVNVTSLPGGIAVQDNLTTQNAADALSANQGYVLNQAKLDKSGGSLSGQLTAGGTQAVAISQVRNVHAGIADLDANVSALPTGTIYLVYE